MDVIETVENPLRELVVRNQVPGLCIRATYKGRELYSRGFGFADLVKGELADPGSTVYRSASISKPITATALLHLVSHGTIALDADLREYVPEFPEKHGRINIMQLASHTAGIRGYMGKEFALNQPYSIAESLQLFMNDPLVFSPGTGYLYNSFDFVLLSLAMERAAQMPFHKVVQKWVLNPLGMSQTYMEIPHRPRPGQAAFYTRRRTEFRKAAPVDTRYKLAGGGYLSTVGDICRLGQAYLEADAIPGKLGAEFLTAVKVNEASTFYGLGWEVSRDAGGRRFFGHTGNAVGAYTNFKVFPDFNLVVSILINASVPDVQPVLDAVTTALLESVSAV